MSKKYKEEPLQPFQYRKQLESAVVLQSPILMQSPLSFHIVEGNTIVSLDFVFSHSPLEYHEANSHHILVFVLQLIIGFPVSDLSS